MMYIRINLNVYEIDTHYTHFKLLRFVAGVENIVVVTINGLEFSNDRSRYRNLIMPWLAVSVMARGRHWMGGVRRPCTERYTYLPFSAKIF